MKTKLSLILLLSLAMVLMLTFSGIAAESKAVDPKIPESWYHAPKLASEMGITEFNQSPMLDEKVASGELPPVADRLPDDPPVKQTYNGQPGQYGGTVTVLSTTRDWIFGGAWTLNWEGLGQATPDGANVIPSLAKGWDVSEDGKTWTVYLRKGMKFSDGEPLTADDWVYYWKYELNNEDLSPVPPEKQSPPLLNITKKDKYTVVFEYGEPYGRKHHFDFPFYPAGAVPGHVLKQYHPAFADKDEIEKKSKEVGLSEWYEYYGRIKDGYTHPEYETYAPTLRPYVTAKRTETYLLLERNPYYPFVDQAGNQLPYIDKIRINFVQDDKMANTQMALGEVDYADFWPDIRNMPLFMKNSKNENYRVLLYGRAYSAFTAQLNLSYKDKDIRELLNNLDFRKALSYAIDREAMNDKVYLGTGIPSQANVAEVSKFYVEGALESYAEYNPEKSRELLDKIGMVDSDGDGWRERPDGEQFNPTWLFCDIMDVPAMEMAAQNWQDIGINIKLKMVSRELYEEQWSNNNVVFGAWALDPGLSVPWGNQGSIAKLWAPYATWSGQSFAPGWVNWYSTDGEEGVEPPQKIKDLVETAKILANSPDPEARLAAGRKLVKAQADNIWGIGGVSSVPKPVIVSNKIKNVPEKGVQDWFLGMLKIYNPVQFYMEE